MVGPGGSTGSVLLAPLPPLGRHLAFSMSVPTILSKNSYPSRGQGLKRALLRLRPPGVAGQFAKDGHAGKKWLYHLPGIRSESNRNVRTPSQDPGIVPDLELEKPLVSVKGRSPVKNGIYLLLLLNLGVYAADHWLQLGITKNLYLYHDLPRWYQFFTSTFCHANWAHLSSNLFFLYIFGKLVEEEEGSFALWLSYLVTGAGANVVSWLILPRSVVSVGASGAVFGLFAISVLVRLSWDWRKLLEVLILGQFVVERVMEAAQSSANVGNHAYGAVANINHIAHLSGALVGVFLIWCISRLPAADFPERPKGK